MYCSKLLIPPKKVLPLIGIELGFLGMPFGNADDSATMIFCLNYYFNEYLVTRLIAHSEFQSFNN